jgi:threonine synthase
VERFIAATNANDVFHRFVQSETYAPAAAVSTISNAMDVGDPNNFPRVLHLFGGNVASLRAMVLSARCTDAETLEAARAVKRACGHLLDPHGAVACRALRLLSSVGPPCHGVVLQTAHAAKFLDSYDAAMRERIATPERLRPEHRGPKQAMAIAPDFALLKEYLMHTSR